MIASLFDDSLTNKEIKKLKVIAQKFYQELDGLKYSRASKVLQFTGDMLRNSQSDEIVKSKNLSQCKSREL
jgi:uncharacterized alpha/beta hydrolase family protein